MRGSVCRARGKTRWCLHAQRSIAGLILAVLVAAASAAEAGSLSLTWNAPTTNADGTPLTDLGGYRIYLGTSVPACPSTSFHSVSAASSAPTAGQTVSARITALAAGTTYYARVTAVDGSGNQSGCTASASGVAQASFSVAPTGTTSFGIVAVNVAVDRTFTVQNTSAASLSVTVSVGAPFSVVSGSSFSLAAGASQNVTVRFRPTVAGSFVGNVNFMAGDDTLSRTVSGSTTTSATTVTLTATKLGTGSGTISSSPAGISCGSDCSQSNPAGTQYTLSAAPASGSIFAGWGGACSGTSACVVTVNANTTVTATFNTSSSSVLSPTTSATTYRASADFSTTQGYRNWYYLYGSGVPMTFDSAANAWRGNEAYLLLWAYGGHPGNAGDAIRKWVAPQAGSIRITGNAFDRDARCGSGATVYIKKNSAVLWQQTLTNGNATGVAFDLTTAVLQGDGVAFGINRGPDGWSCDSTNFDPAIGFTPSAPSSPSTYQASADFSTTQGFRNWYYLYGSGVPMTFDSAANAWRGNEAYLLLWADGGHPGNAGDAIRKWVAPQAGSIRITGSAADLDARCGSGAAVYIKKNSIVLWQQTLTNGNAAGVAFDLTTAVLQGDGVSFGINRGPDASWSCDSTNFDPAIAFIPDYFN